MQFKTRLVKTSFKIAVKCKFVIVAEVVASKIVLNSKIIKIVNFAQLLQGFSFCKNC
jgi:hypothetical protein